MVVSTVVIDGTTVEDVVVGAIVVDGTTVEDVVVGAIVVDGTTVEDMVVGAIVVDGTTVDGVVACPVVDGATVEEAGSTSMVGRTVVAAAVIEVGAGLVVVGATEEGLLVLRTRAAPAIIATMIGTIMVAAILIPVSSFSLSPDFGAPRLGFRFFPMVPAVEWWDNRRALWSTCLHCAGMHRRGLVGSHC